MDRRASGRTGERVGGQASEWKDKRATDMIGKTFGVVEVVPSADWEAK